MRTLSLCLCLIGVLTCAPVRAEPSADFRYQKPLAPGARLDVRNVNGGILTEPSSGDTLEVVATKTGRDASRVQVLAREEGGTVVVCALWPGEDASACREGSPGRGSHAEDVRVDIRLRVPAAVASVHARTMNGELHAKGLRGEASLRTMNGAIEVEARGPIDARTMNGRIEARAAAGSAVHLETVNGPLTLWLPASAGADVDAATTSGHIRSDFGAVPPPMFPALHAATFRVGTGGARVVLHTTNGDVGLRKL
jgi:hypothetical protein